MSFKIGGRERGSELGAGSIVEHGSHGGLLATVISGIALVMSGLSYYETTLKTSDLSVFVPPMVSYARDGRDVFNIPLTIANDGARNGTVLTMELDVEKIGGPPAGSGMKKRKFYAAFIGEYPTGQDNKAIGRAFAPLAIAGHNTFTETVRFYPTDDQDMMLVDDKGEYRFTLSLITAKPSEPDFVEKMFRTDPKPLVFDRVMPYFAIQHIAFRNGTQGLFSKDWAATASSSTDPAAKRRTDAEQGDEQKTEAPAEPEKQSAPAPPPPESKPAPPEVKPAQPEPKAQHIEIVPEPTKPPPPAPPPAKPATAPAAKR